MAQTDESMYIDIPKGYRRLGKFPLDSGSVFVGSDLSEAYAKARAYAREGSMNGIAYIGQVLACVSSSGEDDPQLYTVVSTDSGYDLRSVTSTVNGTDSLAGSFSFSSLSGSTTSPSIKMPAGFIINSVTVTIDSPFDYGEGDIYFTCGNDAEHIAGSDSVAYDEAGEYVIKMTKTISDSAKYLLFWNTTGSLKGSGRIKIN